MMGERTVEQAALFYEFSLERHVPSDHLLRSIDRFVDLSGIREHLRPFYSEMGRPSVDPELMIRMLLIGYTHGIRSERRLCEEVHLNLGYRWFCRLGLDGAVPDHSTFSKNRHGRFRDSDLLRKLFEETVARCIAEGLVGGDGFAVDASLIRAEANRQRFHTGEEGLPAGVTSRAVDEYLAVLDDAAFGGASPAVPSRISPTDPAARYTSAHGGQAQFCYATNYLIDVEHAVIVDVEATTAVRQAEVTAAKRMLERTHDELGLWPRKLIADTGYGSAEMLSWLVEERAIEPHIPVFDKSGRDDGTFSRGDFAYDRRLDVYTCPGGKQLTRFQRRLGTWTDKPHADGFYRYRASKSDCDACELKARCCPGTDARKVMRSVHERARDAGFQAITGGSKLLIVVAYLLGIRQIAEVRRVFQYHGAEHKAISTYEAREDLRVENARLKTTMHPRCGTTFLVMVALVSIIVFTVAGSFLPKLPGGRVAESVGFFFMKLPFLPLIAAITFEIQRVFARYCTTGPLRALLWPGFLVQKITTAEPEDAQLEVALGSLLAALGLEEERAKAAASVGVTPPDRTFTDYEKMLADPAYTA